jgi:alkylation response protein AidB-like acyl-CoA dehydrogenase
MRFDLTATTEPGKRLVSVAEELADEIAGTAGKHDRDGSYPFESFRALERRGYLTAPIPEHLGGLGVTSVHDLVVASSRLARGDASVAIGINMHLQAVLSIVRRWQMAVAAGNERREAAFAASLRELVDERVVITTAISERNQDITRPATIATKTATGWRIDGEKIFCTMSPAATVLMTAVTYENDDGAERYGYALVPADAPGVVLNDDWDAMGMRASGSQSITFTGVELPAAALRGGFPTGDAVAYVDRLLPSGLFHAAASLGIAEAADDRALTSTAARGPSSAEARTRMLAAENALGLAAARAMLSRTAMLVDDHYAANPTSQGTDEELTSLFAEVQAAKTFVNEAATRVVDGALALSGGAGYMNGHPLGRAYRDVRAGAFMHPLGANRAYEYVGDVALGLTPTLH